MKYAFLYLSLIFTFILGTQDGFVALWTDSGEKPAYVFPYPVTSLPREDQIALEKGIAIESPEQLHRLIEDFLS